MKRADFVFLCARIGAFPGEKAKKSLPLDNGLFLCYFSLQERKSKRSPLFTLSVAGADKHGGAATGWVVAGAGVAGGCIRCRAR